jgi:AbrB family looped-hinge helix DNA binding protein
MKETLLETSTVTSKGQLVVPARLRRRFGIKPGTEVRFIEREGEIVFQPVTKEFIRSLQGSLKEAGPATAALLRDRAADRKREEERR